MASDIALRQPLRYAGYFYDSESGLYYLSARTYDPKTCQFLSKDPIDSDGEESPYQYCSGNPVYSSTPAALSPWTDSSVGSRPASHDSSISAVRSEGW